MSLILDALRKLDREKSSHRNGAVNIAAEILRFDLPRPRRRTLVYFSAILLTAIATAAITYAVISKTPPPAATKPVASSMQATPAPLSHGTVRDARDEMSRDPAKMQAPIESKRPVESKRPSEIKEPADSMKQPAEVKAPAPSPSEQKIGPEVIPKEAPVVPGNMRKPSDQTPRRSGVSPASLKLSGIVWSEDPSKRLAVINGMVTTEGYVFEGVKVVEIHPDHVLLLLNDQPFELSLNR
jgi:general secretion pathway protein B